MAVTLGSRPTGGFSIQIDQIEKLGHPRVKSGWFIIQRRSQARIVL
ncbi:protease complex subunit PrcB family protein [Trichocoleus sp. FACHB-262]